MGKKKKLSKKYSSAMAFHGKAKDGTDIVGIGNLRVVIVKDADLWFAQGLEIDYAVEAKTLPAVKKLFAKGLASTVCENLNQFGSIEKLLKPAPPEVWKEMVLGPFTPGKKSFLHSQISFHEQLKALPFKGIDFYAEKVKAAAA
jgi:hypothetical protein